MGAKNKPAFLYYFNDLEDPRVDRKKMGSVANFSTIQSQIGILALAII